MYIYIIRIETCTYTSYTYTRIHTYYMPHATYYIFKGSLVRKLPNHQRLSWLAFSPWWQPHHHLNHHGNHIIMWVVGKCERSGKCEFRLGKHSRVRNPVFCPAAAVVAEGSLFPRLRGLIGESGQRKVHRTVAISISHKHSKKLSGPERFWKMRSTKCAQHCSESSISDKNCKKNCWARCTSGGWGRQNVHETVARARFPLNVGSGAHVSLPHPNTG